MVLSAEQIMSVEDAVFEEVAVPEWGGTVRVRSMSGLERDQWDQSITVQQGGGKVSVNMLNARAKLAALCIVDDQGERCFTDAQALELGKKNASALTRVFEVASRLSGLSEADVEEVTEALGDGPQDGPSSASRASSTNQLVSS